MSSITSVLIRGDEMIRKREGDTTKQDEDVRPESKECRMLLETRKGKKMEYPLEPPEGMQVH